MKHPVEVFVAQVRCRRLCSRLWDALSLGLLAGGVLGVTLGALRVLFELPISGFWIVGAAAVPAVAAGINALRGLPSLLAIARWMDRELRWQDRTASAVQFLRLRGEQTGFQTIQVEETRSRLQALTPSRVAPIATPRTWKWALAAGLTAILLATVTVRRDAAAAVAAPDKAVAAQAERAARLVQELTELNTQAPDPELEQLIAELQKLAMPLQDAGAGPREALVALSAMDAALRDMRQKLMTASGESQLREIGEALSLSSELAEAGQALARGDYEQAAERLKHEELPQLDRPTRTAMSEKIAKATESRTVDRDRSPLDQAAQKLAESLTEQNREKFREGADELAEQSRQQARNKQLADELAQQSRQVNDGKSALESELRSRARAQQAAAAVNQKDGGGDRPGESSRKGGREAGRGSVELNGSPAARGKTGQELKLTAQDTGEGDSDREKTSAKATDVQPSRRYQSSPGRMKALDESALESEAIPQGHRQTIRRYFELIRPLAEPADADNVPGVSSPQPSEDSRSQP